MATPVKRAGGAVTAADPAAGARAAACAVPGAPAAAVAATASAAAPIRQVLPSRRTAALNIRLISPAPVNCRDADILPEAGN
jgi:hypothetical protein